MNELRYGGYSPGKYGLPHMGEVIADYRVRKGWKKQEDFAIVCGVSKQAIAYWESQEYLAEMDRRIFLCKVLSIPPGLLGLTWRSVIDTDQDQTYIKSLENETELLKENAYGLYEDVLALAHTGPNRYAPSAVYRFRKHQEELERLVKQAPEREKDSWLDLLGRYYQHSAFIAQHNKKDQEALRYASNAVDIALLPERKDIELCGTSLYKRARIYLLQENRGAARQDIEGALTYAESTRSGALKGNTYLLAAEVNAFFAGSDEKLKAQCRKWQNLALDLLYKGKVQEDDTFLWFTLYSVHHERAKTLTRFALFHTDSEELVNSLKNTHRRASTQLVKDAHNALTIAGSYLNSVRSTGYMDFSITESRLLLIEREYEESAKLAKNALNIAKEAHSQQGEKQVREIYLTLNALAPDNPYVCNLGIELGIFPR
jgi:transcriptional regulator with XRE-family HTH domain